jgi:mRNA-degrading endonuclease RelE of RelBE toxin-antitoxin system
MYRLRLERRAAKVLRQLPEVAKTRIMRALDEMERDPFSGDIKALTGEWKGFYR